MPKKRIPIEPDATPLSSLADLLRQRGVTVSPPAASPSIAPPAARTPAPAEIDLSRSGKLVLRHERKGHGGKTVTVIEGLALPPARLDAVARLLRKALGCGARAEAGCVIVQGDLADATDAWLRRHGAGRVVRGN